MGRQRLKLRLEFDGGPHCGWQLQSEGPNYEGKASIQSTVERAVATVLRRPGERFPVKGCGRTDSGVHAHEYFAHLDLPEDFALEDAGEIEKFRHSLNSLLPESIGVTDVEIPVSEFHATDDVVSKIYEYRIILRRTKPTIDYGRVYWISMKKEEFSMDGFQKALNCFVGTFDFSAFSAANSNAKTTVREILSVALETTPVGRGPGAGLKLSIRIEGRGFLKQMVRNMVGTALEVALKKRPVESIERLLGQGQDGLAGKRIDAGLCVPSWGLYLMRVNYRG